MIGQELETHPHAVTSPIDLPTVGKIGNDQAVGLQRSKSPVDRRDSRWAARQRSASAWTVIPHYCGTEKRSITKPIRSDQTVIDADRRKLGNMVRRWPKGGSRVLLAHARPAMRVARGTSRLAFPSQLHPRVQLQYSVGGHEMECLHFADQIESLEGTVSDALFANQQGRRVRFRWGPARPVVVASIDLDRASIGEHASRDKKHPEQGTSPDNTIRFGSPEIPRSAQAPADNNASVTMFRSRVKSSAWRVPRSGPKTSRRLVSRCAARRRRS